MTKDAKMGKDKDLVRKFVKLAFMLIINGRWSTLNMYTSTMIGFFFKYMCCLYFSFLILFYHFHIYIHVYRLLVPPPPPSPLPGRICSVLFFSDFVEEKTGDNKKDIAFLLV
jgi:hypothetical protein